MRHLRFTRSLRRVTLEGERLVTQAPGATTRRRCGVRVRYRTGHSCVARKSMHAFITLVSGVTD